MNECGIKASNRLPPSLPLLPFHPTQRVRLLAGVACQFAGAEPAEHYVCTLAEVFAFGKFAELKLADQSRLERGIRSISLP